MDQIVAPYKAEGLVPWVIIIEDASFNAPTSAFCKQYKQQKGLEHLNVGYDPGKLTKIYGGKETHLVISEDGRIVHKSVGSNLGPVEAAIQSELATPAFSCWNPQSCLESTSCMPSPDDTRSECVPFCTVGDDSACGPGEVCYDYGTPTGACWPAEEMP